MPPELVPPVLVPPVDPGWPELVIPELPVLLTPDEVEDDVELVDVTMPEEVDVLLVVLLLKPPVDVLVELPPLVELTTPDDVDELDPPVDDVVE